MLKSTGWNLRWKFHINSQLWPMLIRVYRYVSGNCDQHCNVYLRLDLAPLISGKVFNLIIHLVRFTLFSWKKIFISNIPKVLKKKKIHNIIHLLLFLVLLEILGIFKCMYCNHRIDLCPILWTFTTFKTTSSRFYDIWWTLIDIQHMDINKKQPRVHIGRFIGKDTKYVWKSNDQFWHLHEQIWGRVFDELEGIKRNLSHFKL